MDKAELKSKGLEKTQKYMEAFNNLWIFYEKTSEAYNSDGFNPSSGNFGLRVISGSATSTLSTMTIAGVVLDKNTRQYFKVLDTPPMIRTLRRAVLVMLCSDWESFINYTNNYFYNGEKHFHKYLDDKLAEFILIRNCILHHESIANQHYYNNNKIEKLFSAGIKKRFTANDLIELRHNDIEEFYGHIKNGHKKVLSDVESI